MSSAIEPLVQVDRLRVEIAGGVVIVDDVSFTIRPGEILGVVGQSGSGKTTVGMSLLGYTRHGATITGGRIDVMGKNVRDLDAERVRELRGSVVSYIPQDPRASLNPALRVRDQIAEVLEFGEHRLPRDERIEAARRALEEVGLPSDDEFLARFPHQLSGGQLQRVGIAMAVVAQPPIIVMDEPTTGLDVTTQRRILELVRRLCRDHGIAGLYVTHDLAAVAEIADNVIVMHRGEVVERGELGTVFAAPQHDYTKRLLAASPDINVPGSDVEPSDGRAPSLFEVRNLDGGYGRTRILHDVQLSVGPGECVALVGESGSGKSTLSRAMIGLHASYTGEIEWKEQRLAKHASRRRRSERRSLQYIFQSPFTALNPRKTVRESIEFAFKLTRRGSKAERAAAVDDVLAKVHLTSRQAEQRPGSLSGGERQRAAIARALVTGPELIICDEITSALDVLVQASIIDLVNELRETENLAVVFVTHDLALVRSLADRVVVLERGRVVEEGPTERVFTAPQHPYTSTLLADTLSIAGAIAARGSGASTQASGTEPH